jgi:hypothetical protein
MSDRMKISHAMLSEARRHPYPLARAEELRMRLSSGEMTSEELLQLLEHASDPSEQVPIQHGIGRQIHIWPEKAEVLKKIREGAYTVVISGTEVDLRVGQLRIPEISDEILTHNENLKAAVCPENELHNRRILSETDVDRRSGMLLMWDKHPIAFVKSKDTTGARTMLAMRMVRNTHDAPILIPGMIYAVEGLTRLLDGAQWEKRDPSGKTWLSIDMMDLHRLRAASNKGPILYNEQRFVRDPELFVALKRAIQQIESGEIRTSHFELKDWHA